MSENNLVERLRHVVKGVDGLSINLDARRRLDPNSPKSSAWTLRETLTTVIDILEQKD